MNPVAASRQASYIRMSSAFGQRLASTLDPESLASEACDAIRSTLDCSFAGIWLLDEARERLSIRASSGSGEGAAESSSWDRASLVEIVCKEGWPRLASAGAGAGAGDALGSALALPMSVAGRPIGTLEIESAEADAFGDEDLAAMQSLATQVAVAIRNAELYEAEQRRRHEAEALREASSALGASLDREEVLRRILQGLAQVLELDSASIMLREGERIVFVSTAGVDERQIAGSPPLETLPYIRRSLASSEPIIISDTWNDPDWYRDPENDYIRSWIGVPLAAKGVTIGLMTLDNRKPGFYTRHHAALAASFGGQAAIAIENSRLYKEEERRRKEAEILRDVSAAINASLDRETTLKLILEELEKVLEYHSASIMLKKGKRIEIVAARWPGAAPSFDTKADFSSIPNVRRTMESSGPILIEDTWDDPTWTKMRVEGDYYIRCWIGVPLRVEGETIGLLNVDHRVAGFYGEHDLELATSFGYHAAIAIQNASLYSRAQLEIEERKLAEARTQEANEEKLEFLSGLLAVVSHEVNTPAGVSVTAASHLQSLLRELREVYAAGTMDEEAFLRALDEGEEAMRIVLANLGRVADIVRSFRKIAADQQVEEKRRIDMKEYLDAILLGLKPKLKGASHRLLVACPPGLEAETTPAALYQIIANLILNSLMHAYPDGRSGTIEISISDLDGDLEIAYRDDGVGIPGENLGQIFKPFFTTARARGGTGMGLYIVNNLVGRLGGALSCESEPGQGARFRILFPGATAGSETRHGR